MFLLDVVLVLAILVAAYVAYLLVVAVVPGFSVPERPLPADRTAPRTGAAPPETREDTSFTVDGQTVRAWLYRPDDPDGPVACVVMGPPLGATRDTGLEPYAERFRTAGLAVLLFDYRCFGASGGQPRQLAWIPHQLADYRAAVAHARGLDGVDPVRIGLWGSSLSGGHVLVIAAEDHGIRCVAAQCPYLDGMAAGLAALKRGGLRRAFRIIPHAQRDIVRSYLRLPPHRTPLFGPPGSLAVLPEQEAWESIQRLAPPDFDNRVCARILIRMDKYRPVHRARRIRCPVLLQLTDDEASLPGHSVRDAEKGLGSRGRIVRHRVGHFDVYEGAAFERAVGEQVAWYREHLRA